MDVAYDDMLRAARRAADLSQRALAERAGVSASTVARVEKRRSQPSIGLLCRLLSAAGCELRLVRSKDGAAPRNVNDGTLRDRAGRRYPAHLDLRLPSAWRHQLSPRQRVLGGGTFRRNREVRDRQRWSGYVDPRVCPTSTDLYGLPPVRGRPTR